MPDRLHRTAEPAAGNPEMIFTPPAHLTDTELLREAYHKTCKSASPGIDGVTAEEYSRKPEENLRNLHERLKSGKYEPPPVERVRPEKDDGRKRPIGKPAFEDRTVQRAVAMLTGAVYEQDFLNVSYGFREGCSPHQAPVRLRDLCMTGNIRVTADADISGFFDSTDRERLLRIIRQRINDGGLLKLTEKRLKAGVTENGNLTDPGRGTPQGGVISPLLSDIFLHHVSDVRSEKEIKPYVKGNCFPISFADDSVIGCEAEEEGRELMELLKHRAGTSGLKPHPEKTGLIPFRKPGYGEKRQQGSTSDFPGFTHCRTKSRRGYQVIKRKTEQKGLNRFLKAVRQYCRENRHLPIREQYRMLCLKIRGHYEYFAVRGNYEAPRRVLSAAERAWRYRLSRRSHKGRMNRKEYVTSVPDKMLLPEPRIIRNI